MITFEQYLEMQWARNALGAVGRRLGFGKAAPAEDLGTSGTSEVQPDEPAATQPPAPPPDPNMTPYGRRVNQFPSQIGDPHDGHAIDYFGDGSQQVGRWNTQEPQKVLPGMRGYMMGDKKDGDYHQLDKSTMTPEQKQNYWAAKAEFAKDNLLKNISGTLNANINNNLKPIWFNTNPLRQKLGAWIAKKATEFVNKMNVSYRKGGTAKAGTVNSLTAAGWQQAVPSWKKGIGYAEVYSPEELNQEFEDTKKIFIQRLQGKENEKNIAPSGDPSYMRDKDVYQLYYGMLQQLAKYITSLKLPTVRQ
jgi:hypothetical protein